MNSFSKIINKICLSACHESELSINCNLKDMIFVIYFPFSSVLLTYFSIGTNKVMYFPGFSPKQVSCPSNSSASSFMMK